MARNLGLFALAVGMSLLGCGKSATSRGAQTAPNQSVPLTSNAVAASAPTSNKNNTTPNPDATQAGSSIAEQDAKKQEPTSRPLTDAEIAGVTEAANASEIEAAKVAEKKAKNAEVKRFAGMMLVHHQKAQQDLAKLGIQVADSPVSVQLDTDSASNMDLLKNTSRDFDRVYIDSQVEAHRTVLTLIDSRLLPAVNDPNLRAYLQNIRGQIQAHLEKAQLEQQALSAAATRPPTPPRTAAKSLASTNQRSP
jgi:putative membrane protein